MVAHFLFNESIWAEFKKRVPTAKRVLAAVAYLGKGGSELLPLRSGDTLVVDMSLATVRAGATDPKEVRKLLKRGVEVFSRGTLHAKFIVIDKVVIAGSSNISKNARNNLDEAAILTDDVSAVRRARATLKSLCTEPVRKDYLEKCISEYRPPSFRHVGASGKKRRAKVVQAKLWIIGGLRYTAVPQDEEEAIETVVEEASRKLLNYEQSEVDYTHYPKKKKFFANLREGDWVIICIKDGRGYDVWSPQRYLGMEDIPRGGGKRRYLLLCEKPQGAKPIRWIKLRALAPYPLAKAPRTHPISSEIEADALLRLWDSSGCFKKKRKGGGK